MNIDDQVEFLSEHLKCMMEDFSDPVYQEAIQYPLLALALVQQHDTSACGECEVEYTTEHPYTIICDEAMVALDALLPMYTLPVVAIGEWKCLLTVQVTGVYCPHGYEVDALRNPSPGALREWVLEYSADVVRECCARHGGHY